MRQMSDVNTFFMTLIAESLDLPPTAFDKFFDEDQQHKLKIIKYPDGGSGVGQGVGVSVCYAWKIDWSCPDNMYCDSLIRIPCLLRTCCKRHLTKGYKRRIRTVNGLIVNL
jgi:hypothetical protein